MVHFGPQFLGPVHRGKEVLLAEALGSPSGCIYRQEAESTEG